MTTDYLKPIPTADTDSEAVLGRLQGARAPHPHVYRLRRELLSPAERLPPLLDA